ncbi:MAG: hypothetical protein CMJ83_12060 [Planctomycetes bacterium]|nr:hypothetical protein [Planctomycetota bacterium]
MGVKKIVPLLLIGVLGAAFLMSPAPASGGKPESDDHKAPRLEAYVVASENLVQLRASGVPGGAGVFRVALLVNAASGPVTWLLEMPFYFDATGQWQLSPIALTELAVLESFDVVMDVAVMSGGTPVSSDLWGLRLRSFAPGAQNAPSVGGGVSNHPLPNTQSPTFPYSWATIAVGELGGVASFHCAPTGLEGVIPVN